MHIGASSRAVDDARYRSLAAAYLAFVPTEKVYLIPQGEGGAANSSSSSQDGKYQNACDTQVSPPWVADDGESSFMLSNEVVGSFQSPQVSFRSVVDNSGSPYIRMGKMEIPLDQDFLIQTPMSATQSSWQTPPSVVQDSHPTNNISFNSLTSPTRVLENYLQHFDSPPGSSRDSPQASRLEVSPGQDSQKARPPLSPGNSVPYTPHVVPCTPRVGDILRPSSDGIETTEQLPEARLEETSDDIVIEDTRLLSSSQPSTQSPTLNRADSEPPLKQRQLESLASSSRGLERAVSDIGPRSSGLKAPVTIAFLSSSHGYKYESLEIRPPEPPTAALHIEPHDLITRGLHKLGHDIGLPSRFQPKEQTRELRPYERGHW